MARKIGHVVLIGALLISAFHGTCAVDWDDWSRDLTRMTENIGAEVESYTRNLGANIQRTVQNSLRTSLEPALAEARRTLQNLPRDANGQIISNTGSRIIINSGNGVSRSIVSGHTPDGESYVRDVEERYEGNMLYHNETNYNPKTKTKVRICWKLDLTKSSASPETIQDC
ncbi:PREDICTED: uncharacterized protein LOC106752082 [Dinoponera quadriceps]|uniref:Uncharacterized protein LOC106752082 n=1 Tax=Dinoponera quadriceps TaxID=609295 RepID=A0A6P3YD77_DINQU|nr:PREDICTED: uncharacterized protein LOC106752082 [Dinoponera quadriceps]